MADDPKDDDTIDEPLEVVAPEEVASPEAAAQEAVDYSQEFGESFKGINDPVEIARTFHNNLKYEQTVRQQREQELAYRESQFKNSPEYRKFEEYNRQQADSERKAKESPKFWDGPEGFDPSVLDKLLVKDETTGRLRWAEDASHDTRSKAEQYRAAMDKFEAQLRTNPYEAYRPFVEDRATEIAQQIVQKEIQTYKDEQHMNAFEAEHGKWLFEHNAHEKPVVDPQTGRKILSPWGMRFTQYFAEANGQSQAQRLSIAWSRIYPELASAYQASQKPAETDAEKKIAYQRKAAEKTNGRSGSFPKDDKAKQNTTKRISFADQLREDLKAEGITDEILRSAR